jgi:HEPN domain-containing protein
MNASHTPAVAQKIFRQAQRFHRASQHLRALPQPEFANVAMPALYMSCLAIELFLKCLICLHNGQVSHGHDLRRLFMQMPADWRARICRAWSERASSMERQGVFEMAELAMAKRVPRSLPELLEAASKTHQLARYLWESDGTNLFLLVDLPDVLEPIAKEIGQSQSSSTS